MSLVTLNDLFIEQIADLYDAEQQLTTALPKMAQAAKSARLRRAFEEHLAMTEEHLVRLEQVFQSIDVKCKRQHCNAMEGLITEGSAIVKSDGVAPVKDLALIAAAQRIEHYEIAGYGNARAFAEELGYTQARDLLNRTLDEESAADEALTKIAQNGLLSEAHKA